MISNIRSLPSSSQIRRSSHSEAILAHDTTKKTHQWGLIIKELKCMINFWAAPVPQWPLLWVKNDCGTAVIFTGITTEIIPFLLWASPRWNLYLAMHPPWCFKNSLLWAYQALSIGVGGVQDQAVFLFIWSQFLIVKIVCFVLLSFLYPYQRNLCHLLGQWFPE